LYQRWRFELRTPNGRIGFSSRAIENVLNS
jgi:hypothetical protein